MCTNPIRIYNNARFIHQNYADVYRLVPCGCCVACQHSKETEFALRAYYEMLDCQQLGGYAFWDTLTYRNVDIPSFCGYNCFSRKDVQDFMKRLRIYLQRAFGIAQDALRYFVVSEYGDKQHRPHYHVIYFVRTPKLAPFALQTACDVAWTKGLTGNRRQLMDGLKQSPNDFVLDSNRALLYVSKYLFKDSEFTRTHCEDVIAQIVSYNVMPPSFVKVNYDYVYHCANVQVNLKQRANLSLRQFTLSDFASCSDDNFGISLKRIERHFKPFHLQSIGFGSALLSRPELDVENETATLPLSYAPKKQVALPLYYRRKLFFHTEDIDGRIMWFPNDSYKPKLFAKELAAIDNDVIKLTNRINSVDALLSNPAIFDKVSFYDFGLPTDVTFRQRIYSELGNRSVRDLAIYARFYRGRFSRDVETCYDVITRRLAGLEFGMIPNPMFSDDASERKHYRCIYRSLAGSELDSPAFRGFDSILDFLSSVFSSYSSYALISEIESRKQRKKLKRLSNLSIYGSSTY